LSCPGLGAHEPNLNKSIIKVCRGIAKTKTMCVPP
jgi:hypothetical protein